MPFLNEHACRITEPGKYRRFTRGKLRSATTGKMVSVLYGWYMKGGKEVSEIQAYRYPKGAWMAAAARRHCTRHGGRFEAAKEGA